MNDLGLHIGLFLFVAMSIVLASAMYAEPDDAKALKSLPKRFAYLVVGCGLLAGVMFLCQALFT